MGSYHEEYKKYYQSLGVGNNSARMIKSNSINKRKINKKSQLINYTIFQGGMTVILLFTLIGMKYSRNTAAVSAFNSFNNEIKKESSFTEIIENVKKISFKDIVNDMKGCINNIKEKIDYQL